MSTHIDNREFYKNMLRLALPIALQNMLQSGAQFVDTAMVIGIGNAATAAVGAANRWSFLFAITLFGLCSGTSALIAQYWGAKEKDNIHRTYGFALLCGLAFSMIFVIAGLLFPVQLMHVFTDDQTIITLGAQYLPIVALSAPFLAYAHISAASLRSTESVKPPLYAAWVSVGLNVVLNYVLIYGKLGFPELGIRGAAIATLCANIVQAVGIYFLCVIKKEIIIAPFKKLFDFQSEYARKFFKITMPVFFNELLWSLGTNVYAMVLARQGSENYAAFTLFGSIEQMSFIFFAGLCQSGGIMVGKTIGEGAPQKAYHLAKRFMILTPLLGVVVGLLLLGIGKPIISFLPFETEGARNMTFSILAVYCLWLPVKMINYTAIVGMFRAGGDTKTGMVFDTTTLYLLGIPTVIILGLFVKVPFIWLVFWMYAAEEAIKALLCVLYFRSRRWIRQLAGTVREE